MTGVFLFLAVTGLAGAYWFLLQLLRQHGKVLSRLDAIEKHLYTQVVSDGSPGSGAGGLPAGTILPDFELPALYGGLAALSQWRGRKILLIFFNPSCGFCRDLLPDLASLPVPENSNDPLPVIISTGDERENRRIFDRYGIAHPVLLQKRTEVASLCLVTATPAAYVVDEKGATAGPLSVGVNALLASVGRVAPTPTFRRKGNGKTLTLRGARENNLKSVDVIFPLATIVAITGAPFSGKSTLLNEVLYKALRKQLVDPRTVPGRYHSIDGVEHVHRVVNFDQSPIGAGGRFNPATGFFSGETGVRNGIEALADLGLGHLTPGQSAARLSGSEAQRVRIAAELTRLQPAGHTVYILDEPTTGLHRANIQRLLDALNRLVDAGHTVVLVEHYADVIRKADYVIDFGFEAGEQGGKVVATGTPEEVAAHKDSYTGRFFHANVATPLSDRLDGGLLPEAHQNAAP